MWVSSHWRVPAVRVRAVGVFNPTENALISAVGDITGIGSASRCEIVPRRRAGAMLVLNLNTFLNPCSDASYEIGGEDEVIVCWERYGLEFLSLHEQKVKECVINLFVTAMRGILRGNPGSEAGRCCG